MVGEITASLLASDRNRIPSGHKNKSKYFLFFTIYNGRKKIIYYQHLKIPCMCKCKETMEEAIIRREGSIRYDRSNMNRAV